MKCLQAQDGNTWQMLPEVQPEGWPAGRASGSVAVLGSVLLGYVLLPGIMLLEPAACESTRKLKGSCASAQISRAYGKFLAPVVP